MTQIYKKKLIEVAIPLEAINAACAREKSIRHGHPSTLHLWWARRPLAACRAVLFAQLVDDPSSLPEQFPTAELQDAERKRLFAIIEDLVKWENSTNEDVLGRARAEILRSCNGVLPPVYDPFSGGGSIPLEAQRLGLPAYGSDLNPVAVMIGKAMIEIPPKFKDKPPIHAGIKDRNHYRNAEGLAEDVKYYGEWMRAKAQERIGHLYPQVDLPKEYGGGKATVIAWIWARTVPSPDPAFSDVQVPIASNFLLNSKSGQEAWLEPVVDRQAKCITFRIRNGGTTAEIATAKEGSKSGRGANFRCLVSGTAITPEYVKKIGKSGRMGKMLMAVVVSVGNMRRFLPPSEDQIQAACCESPDWRPSVSLPNHPQYVGVRGYGPKDFGDLFTDRQLCGLNAHVEALKQTSAKISDEIDLDNSISDEIKDQYRRAIVTYLALGISKLSDIQNMSVSWKASMVQPIHLFTRHAIPMVWDFAEPNMFASSAGDYGVTIGNIVRAISNLGMGTPGSVRNIAAQEVSPETKVVLSTDPPYYDNVPYADVSDFFYVWLRRALLDEYPQLFATLAVPKMEELVADRVRHNGAESADRFFLTGMTEVLRRMNSHGDHNHPATIYYAFKQSEMEQEGVSSAGWVTFLESVIDAGYSIVATWPVRTELANRIRGIGANALANSVVLVCRKKEASAEVITRAEFIRALKRELPPAISELQAANIAPADMPQSAIGPGMGVFSRYTSVLESDDSPMSVKVALQLINHELDEYLGGIQGDFDADTRFAITWFEQNGLKAGDYGAANSIAQARGINVERVKHAGIVESQAGKVRVLRRDELDDKWEPGTDLHLTIWECLQHLVRLHEKDGISRATAALLKKISDKAEAVKDLAYILYDISANKRQDAKEANAYNALIADWTELSRHAATIHETRGNLQQSLDL